MPRLSLEELGQLTGRPFHFVVASIIAKFAEGEVPFDVLLGMAKVCGWGVYCCDFL